MGLKRAFAITFSSRGIIFVVQLGATAIIARLLTPEEIGVFSVSMAAVAVVRALRTFGVGTYLIQEKELDADKIATAFSISLILSWGLGFLVLALALPISRFYGNDGMTTVITVLSLSFLTMPFSAIASGLLNRRLRFGYIAKAQVATALISSAISVGLAFAGWSYLALAVSSAAGSIVLAALLLISPDGRFSLRPRLVHWRGVVGFGSYLTGASMIGSLGNASAELILGRTIGLASAAIFEKSRSLSSMIWDHVYPAMAQVLVPTFASEARSGKLSERMYLERLQATATLLWPMMWGLGLLAPELILTLYGDQWVAAIQPARWLCLSSAIVAPFVISQSILISSGRVKSVFKIQVLQQGSRVVLILLFSQIGLEEVAMAMSLASIVYVIATQKAMIELLSGSWGAIVRGIGPAVIALLAVALASLITAVAADRLGVSAIPKLFIVTTAGGIAWLITLNLSSNLLWGHVRDLAKVPLSAIIRDKSR